MTTNNWQLPVQVKVISVFTKVLVGRTGEILCIIHTLQRYKKHILKVYCSLVMVLTIFVWICLIHSQEMK